MSLICRSGVTDQVRPLSSSVSSGGGALLELSGSCWGLGGPSGCRKREKSLSPWMVSVWWEVRIWYPFPAGQISLKAAVVKIQTQQVNSWTGTACPLPLLPLYAPDLPVPSAGQRWHRAPQAFPTLQQQSWRVRRVVRGCWHWCSVLTRRKHRLFSSGLSAAEVVVEART